MTEHWAVTGASGFVGSHLVETLTTAGKPVRQLVRRASGGDEVVGDMSDNDALRRLVIGADIVVHLAARVHKPTRTLDEQHECQSTNVDGTRRLVEAICDTSANAFLIFVSTAAVYPNLNVPVTELTTPRPTTIYAKSKLEAERIVLDAVSSARIGAVVLRPAMVFGPGAPGNLERLIALVRHRLVPAFRGGHNRKSILPVEELIGAILGVADRRSVCNGSVLNVGGSVMSMRQITNVISDELSVRVIRIAMPKAITASLASGVDTLVGRVLPRAPSFRQLIDTYASSAVLDDSNLRALVMLGGDAEVEGALRRAVADVARTRPARQFRLL